MHPKYSLEKCAALLGVKTEEVRILFEGAENSRSVLRSSPGRGPLRRSSSHGKPPTKKTGSDRADLKPIRKTRSWVPALNPSLPFEDSIETAITSNILAYCDRRLASFEPGASRRRPPRTDRKKSPVISEKPSQKGEGRSNGVQQNVPLRLMVTDPDGRKRGKKGTTAPPTTYRKPRRQKADTVDLPKRNSRNEISAEDALEIPKRPSSSRPVNSMDRDELVHVPPRPSKETGQRDIRRPRSSRSPSITKRKEESPAQPKTPLEHILHFARGNTNALAKLEKNEKSTLLKKRKSLATFVGCKDFGNISLAAYIRELASAHLKMIEKTRKKDGIDAPREGLNNLHCDISETDIADAIAGASAGDTRTSRRQRHRGLCPPAITRSIDLVQLVFRLWQRMRWVDDASSQGFLDSWYESGVIIVVSQFAMALLALWEDIHISVKSAEVTPEEDQGCDIVEWCVRLLGALLVFELSPVSSIQDSKVISASLLLIQFLEKHERESLPKLISTILRYVDCDSARVSRECKQAASELCQAFVTRHQCPFEPARPQMAIWERTLKQNRDYLKVLMEHGSFWSLTAHSAIQVARKEEKNPDVASAIAFLVSILSETTSSRSLLQNQAKHRDALLLVLVKLLERVGRNPLNHFIEIEEARKRYPKLPSSIDLIQKLMSFAALQREMISNAEVGLRKDYLESIESIISAISKLVHGGLDVEEMARQNKEDTFGRVIAEPFQELERKYDINKMELSGNEEEDAECARAKSVARYRALAFGAWLISSLGKSMEDGSRDMTQMNGLQVLLSGIKSSRTLKRLWSDVSKIQAGLERYIPEDISSDSSREERLLLNDSDRNHFSMVMYGIQQRLKGDGKDRNERSTPDNVSKLSSPEAEPRPGVINDQSCSFPNVSTIAVLRNVVCTEKGYRDFDDDPAILKSFEKTTRDRGVEKLGRYGRGDEFATPRWTRLQKKNLYIGDARDLLEKADKTLGNPCGCLPGNPSGATKDSQSRIACSNDSCENRSTKVECVPGECGAGSYCQNQRMQKLEYAKMKMTVFPGKGVGVVANEDIRVGSLIGEYQGEVISKKAFEERRKEYEGERHFYFMTLTNKLVIDASRKSQATRFVNHSCEPNAETQKWNAGGEPRVGIFAAKDIPKGEEITFDYGARSLANDPIPCLCKTKSCRGFLTMGKTAEVDADDVPPDVAGLANTEGMASKIQDSGIKATEEQKVSVKDEDGDHKVTVEEQIQRGKLDIANAKEFQSRLDLCKTEKAFDASAMDSKMKERLSKWEASLIRQIKNREPPAHIEPALVSGSAVPSVPRVRIPRRSQESILKRFVPRQESKKPIARSPLRRPAAKPAAPADVYLSATGSRGLGLSSTRPSRPLDSHRREDGRKLDVGTQYLTKRSRSPEREPVQRKAARRGFLPTSSKNKKPPPAPKFASRPRKEDEGSGEDSMDEYSIASDAEPIHDEPILSPSNLPDGTGACSDDEFVAAPPVASVAQRNSEPRPVQHESRTLPRVGSESGYRQKDSDHPYGPMRDDPTNRITYNGEPVSQLEDHRVRYRRHPEHRYHNRPANGYDEDQRPSQAPLRSGERFRRDMSGNEYARDPAHHRGSGSHRDTFLHQHRIEARDRAPQRDTHGLPYRDARRDALIPRDARLHREQRNFGGHRDVGGRERSMPGPYGHREAGGYRDNSHRDATNYRDDRRDVASGHHFAGRREPSQRRDGAGHWQPDTGRDPAVHRGRGPFRNPGPHKLSHHEQRNPRPVPPHVAPQASEIKPAEPESRPASGKSGMVGGATHARIDGKNAIVASRPNNTEKQCYDRDRPDNHGRDDSQCKEDSRRQDSSLRSSALATAVQDPNRKTRGSKHSAGGSVSRIEDQSSKEDEDTIVPKSLSPNRKEPALANDQKHPRSPGKIEDSGQKTQRVAASHDVRKQGQHANSDVELTKQKQDVIAMENSGMKSQKMTENQDAGKKVHKAAPIPDPGNKLQKEIARQGADINTPIEHSRDNVQKRRQNPVSLSYQNVEKGPVRQGSGRKEHVRSEQHGVETSNEEIAYRDEDKKGRPMGSRPDGEKKLQKVAGMEVGRPTKESGISPPSRKGGILKEGRGGRDNIMRRIGPRNRDTPRVNNVDAKRPNSGNIRPPSRHSDDRRRTSMKGRGPGRQDPQADARKIGKREAQTDLRDLIGKAGKKKRLS